MSLKGVLHLLSLVFGASSQAGSYQGQESGYASPRSGNLSARPSGNSRRLPQQSKCEPEKNVVFSKDNKKEPDSVDMGFCCDGTYSGFYRCNHQISIETVNKPGPNGNQDTLQFKSRVGSEIKCQCEEGRWKSTCKVMDPPGSPYLLSTQASRSVVLVGYCCDPTSDKSTVIECQSMNRVEGSNESSTSITKASTPAGKCECSDYKWTLTTKTDASQNADDSSRRSTPATSPKTIPATSPQTTPATSPQTTSSETRGLETPVTTTRSPSRMSKNEKKKMFCKSSNTEGSSGLVMCNERNEVSKTQIEILNSLQESKIQSFCDWMRDDKTKTSIGNYDAVVKYIISNLKPAFKHPSCNYLIASN